MELLLIKPKQALNKAYLKEKIARSNIQLLKKNLEILFQNTNRSWDEEHLKSQLTFFLRDTWYKDTNQINPIEKNDLAIHNGRSVKDSIGIIIEVKSIDNKSEMISGKKANSKALHELVLYYLRERISNSNNEVKYLIATNIKEWFIFDANEFDKKIYHNSQIRKLYEIKISDGKNNPFFYEELSKILTNSNLVLESTYFGIEEYEKCISEAEQPEDIKLIPLYKILSPSHLLKLPFLNDSNTLDRGFYEELLHLIGLEEIKLGAKRFIKRKIKPDSGSLIENTVEKLKDKDSIRNLRKLSSFGSTLDEQIFNISLELCITWINRLLFLKLLESQIIKYNKGDKSYAFLNSSLISDFDDLGDLFFQVLAKRDKDRPQKLKEKFGKVPYLNSSLFERTELERQAFQISELNNKIGLQIFPNSVLKNLAGKKKFGELNTLDYIFEFLDAYDFSSDGEEAIQEENKSLISASVLGLIFEKINGYKDGAFFTPGSITMQMSKNVLSKSIVQKFNTTKGWSCKTLDDVYNKIVDKDEANKIVNSLKICDPAVGSGHFLVSILNEIVATKSELGILQDANGRLLRDYSFDVVNDDLIITDEEGRLFQYNYFNKESQRIQEAIFHEKEVIIENCLFGVDINSNSVKICRLRLWIELLKNAYYTAGSNFKELETLPNIDINIKCGNSLISRFALDANIKKALKSSKWNIETYKLAIQAYHRSDIKEDKRQIEVLLESIKSDFQSYISPNDVRYKKISKLRGELFNLSNKKELFGESVKSKSEINKNIERLTESILKLEGEIEGIKSNFIYDNAFEWRFEFPEILDLDGDFIGFDIVIGNPPYGIDFKNEEKLYIRENYSSYKFKYESYSYFFELALNILRPNGFLEFISPILWLTLDNSYPLRKILIEINNILELEVHGEGIFEEAVVSTCSVLIQKNKPQKDLQITYEDNSFVADKFEWIDRGNLKIEYRSSPVIKKIIDKIRFNSSFLSNFGDVIQGITPYDSYQGQSKEIIESRAYHALFKKDDTYGRWLDGKNLNRYSIKWVDSWISYGDWLAAPREKRFFEGERLLFREVPGKGKRIQASLTNEIYYYGHSISPFKLFTDVNLNLRSILGVVNSTLVSWYGKYTLPNFGKEIFPKLNPNDIKELPIPKALEGDLIIKENVAQILEIKQSNILEDTSTFEKNIEEQVFFLFGLNEDEIDFVKSQMGAEHIKV